MSQRMDQAEVLFRQGCNCSQAVVAAFCDKTHLDVETAKRLSAPFGGGISGMREVCGAVSGMCMVLGLLYGDGIDRDPKAKAAHYALVRSAAEAFEKKNGDVVCRVLLGLAPGTRSDKPAARTSEYYKKRPCSEYVRDAVEILETIIDARENGKDTAFDSVSD